MFYNYLLHDKLKPTKYTSQYILYSLSRWFLRIIFHLNYSEWSLYLDLLWIFGFISSHHSSLSIWCSLLWSTECTHHPESPQWSHRSRTIFKEYHESLWTEIIEHSVFQKIRPLSVLRLISVGQKLGYGQARTVFSFYMSPRSFKSCAVLTFTYKHRRFWDTL